jgi:hypothetical protein
MAKAAVSKLAWLSRRWLVNHADSIAAVDLFTVPTGTFRVLYVFIVFEQARRHIVHFNVTEHPSAQWAAQQLTEAFPYRLRTALSDSR